MRTWLPVAEHVSCPDAPSQSALNSSHVRSANPFTSRVKPPFRALDSWMVLRLAA